MSDKLDSLWAEYREAFPDLDPSASFLPGMWHRIEARRQAMASSWFRLWAEVWLVATVTVTLVMGMVLIPRFQNRPADQGSYVDVLAAADSAADLTPDTAVLPANETR